MENIWNDFVSRHPGPYLVEKWSVVPGYRMALKKEWEKQITEEWVKEKLGIQFL